MRVDDGTKSFLAGEDLARHRVVKLTTTAQQVTYVDSGADSPIGVTKAAIASGLFGPVWLFTKEGTITCTASEAITVNTLVYPDVDGKVSDAGLGDPIGRALQAATADNDEIEVLPLATAGALDGALGTFGDHVVQDDFDVYVTAVTGPFDSTITDSGSAAVGAGINGDLLIHPSDGSVVDNDQSYVHQAEETFLFAANKPLYWEARVKITEAATDTANIMVGVKDAWAAESILDDGAGPPTSYSGLVIYKVDGGTVFLAEASIAGTQTTITLDSTTATTGTWFVLAAEFLPTSATAATVNVYIDGVLVGTASFTFTSATEMEMGCGVKTGASTTEDLLNVDYMLCRQTR